MSKSIFKGLLEVIGVGWTSAFQNEPAKPYVDNDALEAAYTEMANDHGREYLAVEWIDNLATVLPSGLRQSAR